MKGIEAATAGTVCSEIEIKTSKAGNASPAYAEYIGRAALACLQKPAESWHVCGGGAPGGGMSFAAG